MFDNYHSSTAEVQRYKDCSYSPVFRRLSTRYARLYHYTVGGVLMCNYILQTCAPSAYHFTIQRMVSEATRSREAGGPIMIPDHSRCRTTGPHTTKSRFPLPSRARLLDPS